jgi:hypothetical protein
MFLMAQNSTELGQRASMRRISTNMVQSALREYVAMRRGLGFQFSALEEATNKFREVL